LYFGLAFVSPLALVAAPLALLLLFQRPTPGEATIGAVLLGLTAWSVAHAGGGFELFEAAWVCLLAGGVAVALGMRAQETRGRLVSVGLMAVGAAAVAAVVLIAATSFSWSELFWLANRHYSMQARVVLEALTNQLQGVDGGADMLVQIEATLDEMVALVTRLLPALVLLQSVAALAAAWALYRWMVRHPEGDPLPKLREFRFSDQLIWGVVFALVALVFPGAQALHVIGGNLAAFFGGLYVLRGLGIVAALAAAAGVGGPFVALLASFITIVLMPIVMFGALALGVTDTWVDWRKIAAKAKT
jgi:hypothetical protein